MKLSIYELAISQSQHSRAALVETLAGKKHNVSKAEQIT